MKRFFCLFGLAAFGLLAACSTIQTKDILSEADAAYTALAGFETTAGAFCAANPAMAPCPSIPFAKIQQADAEIYTSLSAANTAAAQSNATGMSVALASIKQSLPQALALIPTSSDPTIMAATAALEVAVTTFVTDMGASS